MSDLKIIHVQSSDAFGHYRAGRLIPNEGLELTLDPNTQLEREERVSAGIINADDLVRRDPRCMVQGYWRISKKQADAEDLAAARARETEAAIRENKRRELMAAAHAAGTLHYG